MSIRMIQERLRGYSCVSEQEEEHALREITQEVILAALSRRGFFRDAVFQGGTCLRIVHGLNRFSEDLDFILKEPDPEFDLLPSLAGVETELEAYGYRVEIIDRSSSESAVREAFTKDDSLGSLVSLSFVGRSGPRKKIRVKLELDVNPPAGSGTELRYHDFPFLASVTVRDLPSLFAGKIHALLCREYTKGRDWYDFLWYTATRTAVNYRFLSAALTHVGPWSDQRLTVDRRWLRTTLTQAIGKINWKRTAEDVRRFVPASEQVSLDLWCSDLFLGQIEKIT